MKTIKICAVDFFCGGGGMTYGLRQAGINVLAGIDSDINCSETYEVNNPGSVFIHADITNLTENAIQTQLKIKKNDDNLIFIGCSPCQYWTIINTNKKKSEKSKNLLYEFQRFIDYFNPGYVLVENVPGILKRSNESNLSLFLDFLEKKKYNIDKKIINMLDYGVPQNRKRFSLIATRLKREIKLPEPEKNEKLTVKNQIGIENGFPIIEAGHKDKTIRFHTSAALSEKNLLRLKNTKKNGGNRLSWASNSNLQNPGYLGKDNYFSDVYGRISWDKPAPTITTKFYSISNGRFAHPEEDRGLSIREGATLQTFPKDYIFKVNSYIQAAKIIGNAVPPEFARRLGKIISENYHG